MGTSIAVVGPGAIGSTVAAFLHAAGHQVLLCGRTPREQIEVRPDDKDPIVVPGPVLTDPARLDGPVDVVPAVVWFSSETQPDGWIRLRTEARLIFPATDAAAGLADLLRAAGMTVDLDPEFLTAAWRKLLVNALAGLMVLTGRRSGMFRRDDVAALSRQYLAECLAVARAEGANLDDAVIDELVGMFGAAPEDLTTSMLSDREAHRRLEWDIRNGAIQRKAASHGLETPISDVVVPLLAAASDGPG